MSSQAVMHDVKARPLVEGVSSNDWVSSKDEDSDQRDFTTWIFSWNLDDNLEYTRESPHGAVTKALINIKGGVVKGNPNAIAATLYQDSPRVYYKNPKNFLREAALQGVRGDVWINGLLDTYNWRLHPQSPICIVGGNLPAGVFIRILFIDFRESSQWTQASYTGDRWGRQLLPRPASNNADI